MYEISFKYPVNSVDEAIEKLQIQDVYNVYYNAPIVVTTTDYGYDFYEKNDETIDLNVVVESDDQDELTRTVELVKNVLQVSDLKVKSVNVADFETAFDPVDLKNGWILADPAFDCQDKKKISFIPQGAFGTGLHETTQDCLRYILDEDFTGCDVLDIGTGSGILSLAASLKGARRVVALDIRDVNDEIALNASLNDISNIEVAVGDALTGDVTIEGKFNRVFINIGGEETQMFMDFIDSVIDDDGMLMVSGLVQWSFDRVIDQVENHGYKMIESTSTNEWCTAILKRI